MEPLTRINGDQEDLPREVTRKKVRIAKASGLDVLAILANLPDGEDQHAMRLAVINTVFGLMPIRLMTPDALQRFCDQIRTIWKDLDRSHTRKDRKMRLSRSSREILREWCETHPLNDPLYWKVDWFNYTFFPTAQNFLPLLARVLFEDRHHAGICKKCGRYFRKRRTGASNCYHPDCQKEATKKRVQKHYKIKGRKRTA